MAASRARSRAPSAPDRRVERIREALGACGRLFRARRDRDRARRATGQSVGRARPRCRTPRLSSGSSPADGLITADRLQDVRRHAIRDHRAVVERHPRQRRQADVRPPGVVAARTRAPSPLWMRRTSSQPPRPIVCSDGCTCNEASGAAPQSLRRRRGDRSRAMLRHNTRRSCCRRGARGCRAAAR